jgi:hypothetical protein
MVRYRLSDNNKFVSLKIGKDYVISKKSWAYFKEDVPLLEKYVKNGLLIKEIVNNVSDDSVSEKEEKDKKNKQKWEKDDYIESDEEI